VRTEIGAAHGVAVETQSVQNALNKLREKNFLWRSQRGSYSVEDEQFLKWLAEKDRLQANLLFQAVGVERPAWPPRFG
jgi:Mn-dependent DtxR family transcriptional regulator